MNQNKAWTTNSEKEMNVKINFNGRAKPSQNTKQEIFFVTKNIMDIQNWKQI